MTGRFCAARERGCIPLPGGNFQHPGGLEAPPPPTQGLGFQVGCLHGEGEKKREVGSFPWQLHRSGGFLGNSGKVEAAGLRRYPPPSQLLPSPQRPCGSQDTCSWDRGAVSCSVWALGSERLFRSTLSHSLVSHLYSGPNNGSNWVGL